MVPPCGPWSSQKLTADREPLALKRKLHRPLWTFTRECWDVQNKGQRLVPSENPQTSAAFLLPEIELRPDLCKATVAQCMFGLCDPESGKLYRTRTRLDTNHPRFAEALKIGSQCSHAVEEHEPILGSTRLPDGRSVPKSTWASWFTPGLAGHSVYCARDAVDAGWEEKEALAVKTGRVKQSTGS